LHACKCIFYDKNSYVRTYILIPAYVGLPIPIVAISVGLSYENYGIKDDNGNRIA